MAMDTVGDTVFIPHFINSFIDAFPTAPSNEKDNTPQSLNFFTFRFTNSSLKLTVTIGWIGNWNLLIYDILLIKDDSNRMHPPYISPFLVQFFSVSFVL